MAHTCVSTASASLRLKSPPFSSNPSSVFDHQKTQLTFEPLRFRKLKQLSGNRKYVQHVSAKAVYSGEFGAASSRKGIWSIRDDLLIPPSPYFPIYDGQGQGGPQMGKDGEFGAASSRKGIWSIRDDLLIPASPYFPIYDQGGPQMGKDGPPQEHVQNIIGHLFRHRIIRCGGEVNDDMANLIVAQLLQLDAMNPKQDIVMYINSPGGSVTAGMAIYDTMRHVRPNVSTVCVGLAASMGAFLLSGGHKGQRYSLPSSRIMIHQPLGGAQGSTTDVEVQADEMLHHKANLSGHLAANTGQSLQKIYEDTDLDYFMSAKEAKEYGLIDAIIWNPLKAFRPLAIDVEQQAAADNKSASPL